MLESNMGEYLYNLEEILPTYDTKAKAVIFFKWINLTPNKVKKITSVGLKKKKKQSSHTHRKIYPKMISFPFHYAFISFHAT